MLQLLLIHLSFFLTFYSEVATVESSAHSPEDRTPKKGGLMKFHKEFCNNKGDIKKKISREIKKYVS